MTASGIRTLREWDMKPIAFQQNHLTTEARSRRQVGLAPRALGAIGFGSGVVGLVAVRLGIGSWMILGAAFVIWCFSGWRLFFPDSVSNGVVRALGYVFLSTGILVAAAIALNIYMALLGPSWKP